MREIDYSKSKYYENRELSWLKFNDRVLSEALDDDNPLFERLKFLSITASNLDEFIMVRVASLIEMRDSGVEKEDIAGMNPREQLKLINGAVREQVKTQYRTYNDICKLLEIEGIRIISHHEDLTKSEAEFVDAFFVEEVYPVLTPMAVDSSRPFPLIRNKSLNIGALVTKKDDKDGDVLFATVQVPQGIKRVLEIPNDGDERVFILLEEVIERNIDKLFLNMNVITSTPYRVMRSAGMSIEEDETDDLLKEIERQIKMRQWGKAIRLEVEKGMDRRLLDIIQKELMVTDVVLFENTGALDLTYLMQVYGLDGCDKYKEHRYLKPLEFPALYAKENIFEAIKEGDHLLYHPYHSFMPVVDFIKQAAEDDKVLAIKQTLYRVSGNSPIVAALAEAADKGKQVTVLVELKARFDEENNIIWARRLERAGCHVIYGLVGLKTHSKITLVVRREEDGIRRYVHLGTGNYNDSTAKLYTDLGLFTADEAIGEDATAVFNMLSGYSEPKIWNSLSLAPLWLKDRFLFLINREKENAKNGIKAHIIAKMNSLCDPDVIRALYEAAHEGVKIELIIRGICCIKTDVPGTNNNITVRSIVGNFLEHARIYYFENAGKPEYYCSSADWMPRNLERRVEILFPIKDETNAMHLKDVLAIQLEDNEKAHLLMADGTYARTKDIRKQNRSDEEIMNSQLETGIRIEKDLEIRSEKPTSRVFTPKTAPEN
ncbi:MAG: RNA degradosome polyphosphate kinase [Lachnospiraceae bacterium]|nr:RNA degradosome polyphosphate kinase [Lachnospiraceae bacterium]